MLISLLTYVLLGLLLALPLWKLLPWLLRRYAGYRAQWQYLRPYAPGGTVPDRAKAQQG